MYYELIDLIEEIKMEMEGYEEIEQEYILDWEEKVLDWSKGIKSTKNKIVKENNRIKVFIEDEADIFKIVDRYYSAIINNELEEFWKGFFLV